MILHLRGLSSPTSSITRGFAVAMSVSLDATIVKIRIVVHTMGLQGWEKSRNHWSIYLVEEEENVSVRLNMTLAQGSDDNGTLFVTRHNYTVTNSQLHYFDFTTMSNITVGHIMGLIYQRGRQNYEMTGSGNGCRYWV